MLTMTRRHPGRLPPAEQREQAIKELTEATERFRAEEKAVQEELGRRMAQATAEWNAAIVKAAGPPEGVPGADQKSLVTRAQIREITQLGSRRVAAIVNEIAGSADGT